MEEFGIKHSDIVMNQYGSICYYKKELAEYAKPQPKQRALKIK